MSRVSLSAFLAHAKLRLRDWGQTHTPMTFVLGNESADLDSLCSAVLYAYFRTYCSPQRAAGGELCIPVANIPASDLRLRPELDPVFRRIHLKPSDLITLSDLPSFDSQADINRTKWFLVDHNALQGRFRELFAGRVRGCLDHHDEEHFVPDDCGEEPRIIKRSGSCASLIVEHCRPGWDSWSDPLACAGQRGPASAVTEASQSQWRSSTSDGPDQEIAILALAPILIDTTDLHAVEKTEPVDREAVHYLESKLGPSFDRVGFFEEIQSAKANLDGLSLQEILRKDYKAWTHDGTALGICSIVQPMDYLLDRADGHDGLLENIRIYASDRALSIVVLMTTSRVNGVFQRELLAWGLDDRGTRAVDRFARGMSGPLKLETWGHGKLDSVEGGPIGQEVRYCWRQGNLGASRKQVGPMFRDAMKGL